MSRTIDVDVELVVPGEGLAEGPQWDERANVLWWVDSVGGAVHRYDPATRADEVFDIGGPIGAAVPRASGGLVLALPDGFHGFEPSTGKREILVEIEASIPGNRLNDSKCDPAGRLWGGTMSLDLENLERGKAALYCTERDLSVRLALSGVSLSNGLGWSPDGKTMYYVDSFSYAIDAFDFDVDSGSISNRRHLIKVSEADGLPDGLTVDADGYLWVAVYRSWWLRRFAPDGTLDRAIVLPVPLATSCGFGGADLSDLYITTYRAPDSPPGSPAGGVFRCEPGFEGQRTIQFAG